jgi:hypothetical protein
MWFRRNAFAQAHTRLPEKPGRKPKRDGSRDTRQNRFAWLEFNHSAKDAAI